MAEAILIIEVLSLVIASFVATNIDNLVLLVGWLLIKDLEVSQILIGYLLGMLFLLSLSIAIGFASKSLPISYIGFLGVIPILLGTKTLLLLTRGKKEPAEELNSTTVIASVAVAQISNGVDTVLVFSPLVADSRTEIDFSIAAAFIVVTCLWFGLAKFLCFHVSQLEPITRIGRYISPLVMIIVGLYILDNTATDLIAGD